MSAQSPGTIARIIYNAYGTREFERVSQWFAADAELSLVPTGDTYHGPEGYLQLARAWAAAIPDLRVELQRVTAGADSATVEYLLSGTHTGALISQGGFVPPTWSRVELRFCDVLHLRDDKVARVDSYFDSATMLRQMGLLPNSPLHAADRRAALDLYATQVDNSVEQRNKAIVHRFLEEVINQRNPAAAVAVCSHSLAWHGGAMGQADDLAGFQSRMAAIFAAFPDLSVEVHDVIAEQDRVAVRLTVHGTQLGEFQGIPPTGKRITSSAIDTFRIADNRIVEEWWQHDVLGVMRQIDAMPAVRGSALGTGTAF